MQTMRAITLIPGQAGTARLDELPLPPADDGGLLVRALALGLCGTDHDILAGHYGAAPPHETRLILGHESLGEVIEAPASSGFKPGDRVVGIVRRPDPVPCPACASGEWDMCCNGLYTERGIKERHGFGSEFFRLEPAFAIHVPAELGLVAVLTEPASIIAKAWQQVMRIGSRRASFAPRKVLVTGAGPIGLLAALIAAQAGLELHVLERKEHGRKAELLAALGAIQHANFQSLFGQSFDIVMECTGAPSVIADAIARSGPNGIACLLGVSLPGEMAAFDIGGMNRKLVLGNQAVFGSVNANAGHYKMAIAMLEKADKAWLERMITRRLPLSHWQEALSREPDDIKVVIDFAGQSR